MFFQYPTSQEGKQASPEVAQHLAWDLETFLRPLVRQLDAVLDRRLVRTVVQLVALILQFRHRANGLLLTELGGLLAGADHAPAGTKRLSNLLRSTRWGSWLIERFLWERAQAQLTQLERTGEQALLLWDESVLEKPSSLQAEGLCAVRSSKARLLKRIKPGYFNPPGGKPICVPGLHWVALLLIGRQGPPTLAALRWWTSRGARATTRREEEIRLLTDCARAWGRRVLHTFDRGFAGGPWLQECVRQHVRFLLRWPKGYKLIGADGIKRLTWHLARGKRSWGHRQVWDAHDHCWRTHGVLAVTVYHSEVQQTLWLVISRPKGHLPWYLLTNEPITTEEDAWRIVFAYARRWQSEMMWRYSKSELAFESPRLWQWDNRLKLLLLATLAYAFLLSLLEERLDAFRQWLLRQWCHRTGKRCRETTTPLYRLRSALSSLWGAYRPAFSFIPGRLSG